MKKISIYLGGMALLFLILILLLPNSALAKEGECHLDWCLVPSPTVLGPEKSEAVNSLRPGIKGLTWKTTIVKVYLDGKELTNVKQIKHEDYYGSFFVRPDFDLKPGKHYVYTIAHSEKPSFYDQSKESIYIYFIVKAPTVSQVPLPPSVEEGQPVSQEDEPVVVIQPEIESDIQVETGKIEGGVSVVGEGELVSPRAESRGEIAQDEKDGLRIKTTPLQEAATTESLNEILEGEFSTEKDQAKERQNRLIGLSMLGVVILIIVVWAVASRFGIRHEFSKPIETELPPPPVPPLSMKQESLAYRQAGKEPARHGYAKGVAGGAMKQDIGTPLVKNEEIIIEPIKEEDDLPPFTPNGTTEDYWASPPPSPYSPYPPIEEEKENERDRLI